MINFSHPDFIGLERTFSNLKGARIGFVHGKPVLKELFVLEKDNVKQLYINRPILVTGLEATEVLVRSLTLPLTKQKQLEAALAFQAEPLLPYPVDQAVLAHQIVSKGAEETELTLLAVRQEELRLHLEAWRQLERYPNKSAVCTFTGRMAAARERPDGTAGDEGIASAIAEEPVAPDGHLAAGGKPTEKVNKANKSKHDLDSGKGSSSDVESRELLHQPENSAHSPWMSIEPEKVSCLPFALSQFGSLYLPTNSPYLILHVGRHWTTCVLVREGKLLASLARPAGMERLFKAQAAEKTPSLPDDSTGWKALDSQSSLLAEAFSGLRRETRKVAYALAKELKAEPPQGILVAGEAAEWKGLSEALAQSLPYPLIALEASSGRSPQQLLSYAVPIGLAFGALPSSPAQVDFRQGEMAYPHPWKRWARPALLAIASMALLSGACYFLGSQYLLYRESHLRQDYLSLLTDLHQSHEEFETAFAAKNPGAHARFDGAVPLLEEIESQEILPRLAFLKKQWLAAPDSFALFPNIPRVSDLLAWLSQHPAVSSVSDGGTHETRLQIENFHYLMVKRPQHGKKQEKYQVRVELEFSSPTPKWAREFHDALIAPNDWVDPKGEIKWSTNRGKYKTSFFLKDKTFYPGGS